MLNGIIEAINRVGAAWWAFSGSMLIQASILIIILLVIDLAIRRHVRAVVRYVIWMLVLVKLVLPTNLALPTGAGYWAGGIDEKFLITENKETIKTLSTKSEIQNKSQFQNEENRKQIAADFTAERTENLYNSEQVKLDANAAVTADKGISSVTWQGLLFLAWLAGVAALAIMVIQRIWFVRALVAQSKKADEELLSALRDCQAKVGVRSNVQLRLTSNMLSPAACGLWRPVILMPESLLANLSSQKLRAVLTHELVHIKRGDLWFNMIQTILQVVYFYNPLVWVANAIIRQVREQAVDETTLANLGDEAKDYGTTLVDIAEMTLARPHFSLRLVGVVESKKSLAGRIKHIMSRPMPKNAKIGIGGIIAALIIGAVLLPMAKAGTHAALGQKTNSKYYIDAVHGYIRGNKTLKECSTAIFNMAHAYGFKPSSAKSTDFGNDASPIQHLTEKYIIDDNKGVVFRAIAEKGQQLRINIDVEAGGLYTTDEITTELARQLELLPKTMLPLSRKRSMADATADANQFSATLANGVTVELVGICEYPSKGKQWWKPNGEPISDVPFNQKIGWEKSGPAEIARVMAIKVGRDINDIDFTVRIPHVRYTRAPIRPEFETTNTGRDMFGVSLQVPDQIKSIDVNVGIAASQWKNFVYMRTAGGAFTAYGDDGKHVNFDTTYEKDGMICIPVAWESEPELYAYRVVAINTEGKVKEAAQTGYAGDKLASGTWKFKMAMQDVNQFVIQRRPYEWVEFKNVALRPKAKATGETAAQISNANFSWLEGTVSDQQGKRIHGATAIGALPMTDSFTYAAPDGSFILTWAKEWEPSSQLLVWGRDKGRNLAGTQPFTKDSRHVHLILKPGIKISGTLVDSNDTPVTSVRMTIALNNPVGVDAWSYCGTPVERVFTDNNGFFQFTALPKGLSYRIGASIKMNAIETGLVSEDYSLGKIVLAADCNSQGAVEDKNVSLRTKPQSAEPNNANASWSQNETTIENDRRPVGNCSLSGKVISAEDGKPVPNATIYFFCVATHDPIFITPASDGSFEFKNIPAGQFSLQVINTPEYQDEQYNPAGQQTCQIPWQQLKDGEQRSGIVLKLKPSFTISGKVLDENGKPFTNSTSSVTAWHRSKKDGGPGELYHPNGHRSKIAADGSYKIAALDGSAVYVMVEDLESETKDDYYPPCYYPGTVSRKEAKPVTFDSSRAITNADIRLTKNGQCSIEGTVKDLNGKPIQNALITAHHTEMLFDNVTEYTDANGVYRINTIGPGDYLVHADAEPFGYVRSREPVVIESGTKTVDFTLNKAVSISGTIVDTSGKPVDVGPNALGWAKTEGVSDGNTSWSGSTNKFSSKSSKTSYRVFFGGRGDYHFEHMDFPTPETFIIQGMPAGKTIVSFEPKNLDFKVVDIKQNAQSVIQAAKTCEQTQALIDTQAYKDVADVTIVVERTSNSNKNAAPKTSSDPNSKPAREVKSGTETEVRK